MKRALSTITLTLIFQASASFSDGWADGCTVDTYTGICVPNSSYGETDSGDFFGTSQDNASGIIYESSEPKPIPFYDTSTTGYCSFGDWC